jgi:hypothetical protein
MSEMDAFRERALSRIPLQLQREDLRFVRIDAGSKKPFERQWAVPGSNTNYKITDEKFLSWVGSHQNYGALTGAGGLCVFDADNLVRLTEIGLMGDLPDTFTVRTGGGGLHLYYTSDLDQKIIMFDRELKDEGKPLHLGEVQSRGAQIVCPSSIHPNGKAYTTERDLPIASLDSAILKAILSKYVDYGFDEAVPEKKRLKVVMVDPNIRDPFDGVRVEDVLSPRNARKALGQLKGAHPIHGSVGGNNFIVDLKENSWRCWRCCSGGGPALAIAVKEGIIRCDQARAGVLRGDLFKQTVDIARAKGYTGKKAANCKVERVI